MKDDPIVAEVREAGDAYFRKFNHDLKAVMDDLRRLTEEQGDRAVSLPPKLIEQPGAKKVG